jgi:hypothetical protein
MPPKIVNFDGFGVQYHISRQTHILVTNTQSPCSTKGYKGVSLVAALMLRVGIIQTQFLVVHHTLRGLLLAGGGKVALPDLGNSQIMWPNVAQHVLVSKRETKGHLAELCFHSWPMGVMNTFAILFNSWF